MTEQQLASAIGFYSSQFNLDDRVAWLDLICIEHGEQQDRGLKSRKVLSEETKQTKRHAQEATDSTEIVAGFTRLLKLYQQEIDSLSKRAKSSESALGELYRALYQAPNPAPLLVQCQTAEQALLKLKVENSTLKVELAEFETEFAQLNNQDITIRQLNERVGELQLELANREATHAQEVQRLAVGVSEELDLQRELDEVKQRLGGMEVAYEEQQRMCDAARHELFEYKFHSEERDQARLRELEQVQEDLLTAKSASSAGGQESELARIRQRDLLEEDKQRARREEEMAKLYTTLDQHRLEASRLRTVDANREKEMDQLKLRQTEQQQRDRERIQELEDQLAAKPSFKEQQLVKGDEDDEEVQREADKSRLNASLETLNAQLRITLSAKEQEVAKMQAAMLDMEEQLMDGKQLARKLQDQVDSNATIPPSPRAPHSPLPANRLGDHGDSGVVAILQEQRDRFRRRMLELEQELEASTCKEKRTKEQLDRMRMDNRSLTRTVGARTRNDFTATTTTTAGSRSPLYFVAKFLASHSTARTAVAVYFLVLHLMVFLSSFLSLHL